MLTPDSKFIINENLSAGTEFSKPTLHVRAPKGSNRDGWVSNGAKISNSPILHRQTLHPGDKTKPRFLIQISHFMQKELSLLGADNVSIGDPRRLQVCREAFASFVEEFRTYAPVLSQIQNEYEACFLAQRRQIEKLIPFKSKLSILEYESSQERNKQWKLSEIKYGELESRINQLLTTKDVLEKEIASLKSLNSSLAEQVLKGESQNVREEFLQEKVKRLELYYQKQLEQKNTELEDTKYENALFSEELEESVRVRAAVEQQLNILKQDAKNLVSKILYKQACDELEKLKTASKDSASKLEFMSSKLNVYEKQLKENNATIKSLQNDRYPNWDVIQTRTPGPIAEYGMKCRGCDFNDSIVILLREILKMKLTLSKTQVAEHEPTSNEAVASQDKRHRQNYFAGLGLSSEVPRLLRYSGKVKNRRLNRQDCCSLIREIWKAKIAAENASQKAQMADFLHLFLKKKFSTQEVVVEWAMNLYEASRKHAEESAECQMFFNVVTNKYSESIYHHVVRKRELLREMFHEMDAAIHDGKGVGFIPREKAFAVLHGMKDARTPGQIDQLKNAIDADQPQAERLSYRWLFDNTNDSMFSNVLGLQELEIQRKYIDGLQKSLDSASNEEKILVADIEKQLVMYDQRKPKKDIIQYLLRGLGLENAQEVRQREAVSKKKFLDLLQRDVLVFGALENKS